MEKIKIEVVYATPTQQIILPLVLQQGCDIRQAIIAAKLFDSSAQIEHLNVGIFGRVRNLDYVLEDGDRVEIYRALKIDPKVARRKRADRDRRIKGTKK